ncbi:NAD-dependent epimerase/dehydratase family protein [Psychroflexus salarius]|nr:NAD-dependent epimerase/dehydratase family protein [Psychroflexus salarius]
MSQRYHYEAFFLQAKYIYQMNLITGATGFLGTHLTAHLVGLGENCICFYRTETKRDYALKIIKTYSEITDLLIEQNIKWVKADLLDIPKLNHVFSTYEVTQVYHCAGMISNAPSDYKKLRKVNIEGTANIINFSLKYHVQKFCHVSSIATLSKNPELSLIDEQITISEHDKTNAYAIAKYGAEREAWRGSQEGLNLIIVNPGVILGHGFYNQGSGEIINKYAKGFQFYFNKTTGFVGVYDCCKAMHLLMQSSLKNERYILVAENLNFKILAAKIATLFSAKPPRIKIKKWMLFIFWLFSLLTTLLGKKRQMTKDLITSLFESDAYSNDKIKTAIQFEFQTIDVVLKQIKENSNF